MDSSLFSHSLPSLVAGKSRRNANANATCRDHLTEFVGQVLTWQNAVTIKLHPSANNRHTNEIRLAMYQYWEGVLRVMPG